MPPVECLSYFQVVIDSSFKFLLLFFQVIGFCLLPQSLSLSRVSLSLPLPLPLPLPLSSYLGCLKFCHFHLTSLNRGSAPPQGGGASPGTPEGPTSLSLSALS